LHISNTLQLWKFTSSKWFYFIIGSKGRRLSIS